ncbi:hypothetical protein BD413DRAFT_524956 [Trametes elegans]|nr:hypothetical protein BD413DRAFT_524956 [Trametes elegans]
MLLRSFYVPAATRTHVGVTTDVDPSADLGKTFASMLPEDRRTFPLSSRVDRISVSVSGDTYTLVGGTPRDGKVVLELQANAGAGDARPAHAALFESVLRNIGLVFAKSPVAEVMLVGDMRQLTQDSWRAALGALPGLARLRVGGAKESPSTDGLLALCETLQEDSVSESDHKGALCPNLQHVVIYGAMYSQALIDQAEKLLVARDTMGKPLEGLTMGLRVSSAEDQEHIETSWKVLRRLVRNCVLRVIS